MTLTVSSTRGCTSAPRPSSERPHLAPTLVKGLASRARAWVMAVLVCGLALMLAAWAPSARATEITALSAERGADGVIVSAQVRLELPALLDDALQKGIPVFFVAEAVVLRERWYWTDKEVASASRHLRLAFHPLTRRWRLQASNAPIGNTGTVLGQTFESREEAMSAIERFYRWKIAEAAEVDGEGRHTVTLRFRVDQTQLPRPFQIGALGQGDAGLVASRSVRLANEPAK